MFNIYGINFSITSSLEIILIEFISSDYSLPILINFSGKVRFQFSESPFYYLAVCAWAASNGREKINPSVIHLCTIFVFVSKRWGSINFCLRNEYYNLFCISKSVRDLKCWVEFWCQAQACLIKKITFS